MPAPHPAPSCLLCRIAAGEAPAERVFEDGDAVAFLDIRPLLRGHVLVCPRRHVETFHDLDDASIGPFFTAVQRISRAVERGLGGDGAFAAINTRVSQSVPHLHVHVVPRWRGDGLFSTKLIWRRTPYRSDQERAEVAGRIRAALAAD